MAHKHSVYDTDAHFKIDRTTREIKNDSTGKTVLIQHDHKSERLTFEMPRTVDGHDASTCNVVQVHYLNIDSSNKTNQSAGISEVDDLQISPDGDDVVICSWLVPGSATKYAGSLNFVIRFCCVSDDGTVEYAWNTALYSGISVSTGICNSETVVDEYADVLEQWYQKLFRGKAGVVQEAEFTPVSIGTSATGKVASNGVFAIVTLSNLTTAVNFPPGELEIATLPEGFEPIVGGVVPYNSGKFSMLKVKVSGGKVYLVNDTDDAFATGKLPYTATFAYALKEPGMVTAEQVSAAVEAYLDEHPEIIVPGGGASVELDTTLTQSGKAADAKAVGDALAELEAQIPEESGGVSDYPELTNKPKINGVEVSGDKTSADYGIGNPTDEQVAASVEAWLDKHPEATTTVADGSITEAKLADGAVNIAKLSDMVFATDVRTHVDGQGGWPTFFFPLNGKTNTTLTIEADIELLNADGNIGFNLRMSETDNDKGYGTLTYGAGVTLDSGSPTGTITETFTVTDKAYFSIILSNGSHVVSEYTVKFRILCEGELLDWTNCVVNWGTATVTKNAIFATQTPGALATVDTAKEIAAEAAADAKAYTDESLVGYVYEIPDKNVTLAKIADSAFKLDEYSVLTLSKGDFAFLSLDISGIDDRNGKTAEVEYYYTPLDENFTSLSNRMATGGTTGEFANASFTGSRTVVDEANKIYRINATYTIASDTHAYLNLYPQIGATAETQVKFYGVKVTVDGKKLEWVEAHRFSGGTVFPIVGVYQEGEHLLKLEHAEQLIADAIGSVEASVNDAKDEVAQLKNLIGDGTTTAVESVLNGKKWGVVGDSITFGTGATDASKTYHGFISAKYLMTISNQGVAGKSIALRPTYNDTLIDNVNALPTDCDYVTVFAGTNDYGNGIAIGTFADTTNATFYGAMKLMCEALYARFGGKKFAFFTPTQRSGGNTANSASKTLKDYRDVIIEVCGYYGIPVLDLYAESGINPNLCGDFTGDGLHLNDAGHERISNRIAKFLESL